MFIGDVYMNLKNMLVAMAVSFVTRQVQKFADTVDVTKVKADLDLRIRALVPGEFFDDEACNIVNRAVDIALGFIKGDVDDRCAKLMAEGKFQEALELAIDYVKGQLGL